MFIAQTKLATEKSKDKGKVILLRLRHRLHLAKKKNEEENWRREKLRLLLSDWSGMNLNKSSVIDVKSIRRQCIIVLSSSTPSSPHVTGLGTVLARILDT